MKRHNYAAIRKQVRQHPYPEQIAAALKVHHSTVYRACSGMDIKLIRDAYEAGIDEKDVILSLTHKLPDSAVAKKLGISPQYVHQVKKEEGYGN
jgi:DNA-directed RNA polymerase specialized sigma subunit